MQTDRSARPLKTKGVPFMGMAAPPGYLRGI